MQIMTEAYKDREYFVPLNQQKTEGFWGKPLSSTLRRKIAQEAIKESGGDMQVAAYLESVKLLQAGITRWTGMYDMGGEEIAFSAKNVELACECDPDIMAGFLSRLKNIARFGELEDEKN